MRATIYPAGWDPPRAGWQCIGLARPAKPASNRGFRYSERKTHPSR